MTCPLCDDTGHLPECESLEPAYDLGDLICRAQCSGCCPNKCTPKNYLQREQDKAQRNINRLLRRPK